MRLSGPARTRSRKISRSYSAKTAKSPAIARWSASGDISRLNSAHTVLVTDASSCAEDAYLDARTCYGLIFVRLLSGSESSAAVFRSGRFC